MRTISQNGRPLKKGGKSHKPDTRVKAVTGEKQEKQLIWRKQALWGKDFNTLTPKQVKELERVERLLNLYK